MQFGIYAVFFSTFILIRMGTIMSWQFENDKAYKTFRGMLCIFKELQFSVLIALVAIPKDKVLVISEKICLKSRQFRATSEQS